MFTMDEHQAVEHVCAQLGERFPEVPAVIVRRIVHEVHSRFDGPVRAYVPILVEREAKARLAVVVREVHDGAAR